VTLKMIQKRSSVIHLILNPQIMVAYQPSANLIQNEKGFLLLKMDLTHLKKCN